jgi:hypothetical protein
MSLRACLLWSLLAGCATPAPIAPTPAAQQAAAAEIAPPAPHVEKWKSRNADADCQANLSALAEARLDAFKGLGRCGRVDAEAALGSSGDAPSKFEQFGEYRVYPHQGGSILVWFLAEDIRVLQLLYPKFTRPLHAVLGEPEARVKSELSAEWDQLIWAGRGLTAHVRRGSNEVIALFCYRPTTVDAFLKSDIARVSKSEAPLEELK